ncbi:hypothetical protein G2W53_000885 [Senna tora]|uniref:Uncharacterized protein n=1 Tax=Senna tora TaxID=362788 RepID=A0A834XGG6_9FABA|nr:hypothetical protein G2W53_000885 [Senna tora]
MWMITRYNANHTCASTSISNDHAKLDSDMIVGMVGNLIANEADIPISLVVEEGTTLHSVVQEGMEGEAKGHSRVYGSWEASYDKLRGGWGCSTIAMPRTIVPFQTIDMQGDDSAVQFQRLFEEFKPCIDAWWHLKPMLQVDGAFLGRLKLHGPGSCGGSKRTLLELVVAQINAGHMFCEELQKSISKKLQTATTYEIKLENFEKGEFEFQQLHFPCIHALAAYEDITHDFGIYVDPIYRLDNMLVAYSQQFHPIRGEAYWPYIPGRIMKPNLVALRPPGRPQSSRICNETDWKELGNKPKCSLCSSEEHTKKKFSRQPMRP